MLSREFLSFCINRTRWIDNKEQKISIISPWQSIFKRVSSIINIIGKDVEFSNSKSSSDERSFSQNETKLVAYERCVLLVATWNRDGSFSSVAISRAGTCASRGGVKRAVNSGMLVI